MKKIFCKALLICASASVVLVPLRAATITFDQIPVTENDLQSGTITTQGFDFTSASFHIINDPGACAGGCVDDGSQYLAVVAPLLDSPVTVTSAGGGLFSVTGLDGAKLFLTPGGLGGAPNADTLDLLGNLAGGGTVSTSLTLGTEGSFETFSLAGFSNLTSLVISGTGGGSNDASWAVDNLVALAVPEPSGLGLMSGAALGFAALYILSRRRRVFFM